MICAHTSDEQRDTNEAQSIFGGAAEIKTGPATVALAPSDHKLTAINSGEAEACSGSSGGHRLEFVIRRPSLQADQPTSESRISDQRWQPGEYEHLCRDAAYLA